MPSLLKPIESSFSAGSFLIGINRAGCQEAEWEGSGVASWLCLLLVAGPRAIPVPILSIRLFNFKRGDKCPYLPTVTLSKPQSPEHESSDGQWNCQLSALDEVDIMHEDLSEQLHSHTEGREELDGQRGTLMNYSPPGLLVAWG